MQTTKADLLRARVKRFAVRLLRFIRGVRDPLLDGTARQLARSGTGVSSNYHSACRARSRAEFIAKLGIVVEEADEAEHWLNLWRDGGFVSGPELNWLLGEAGELRAIFLASLRTARRNHQKGKSR
jgi:four helix bundle protein